MRLPIFLLLLFVSPVFAFPSLLSLDGFLTNSSGSALNGSFSFVFSLYNVSSGGSALWTETRTITVSSGKLNALLGSVSALNLPFDQDYYLGVKVSTDSEMTPRYRVASSAYAYTSRNLVPGANATGDFYISGNASVGAGLKFGDSSSACDSSSRGTMKYVAGGSGVADSIYQCMKRADGNYSWIVIKSGSRGVSATGGTITEVDGYRIHTFTSSGTFTVSEGGNVEYLVVAGGGAGGAANTGAGASGGGGGAGGFRAGTGYAVIAQAYAITVGAGGAGVSDGRGNSGSNSVFDTIVAVGGGGGGIGAQAPFTGGSGGGGDYVAGAAGTAGQGYAGGTGSAGSQYTSGGGGGAGGAGGNAAPSVSGNGGPGLPSSISGSTVYYAGGGGGGAYATGRTPGTGGQGGGGTGMSSGGSPNTGGGGGAGSGSGYSGGSGIVIIRYLP